MIPHRARFQTHPPGVLITLGKPGGILGHLIGLGAPNPEGKEMLLACTSCQYNRGIEAYKQGAFVQDAFSFLTAGEREFLMTGLKSGEWDEMWKEDNEGREG